MKSEKINLLIYAETLKYSEFFINCVNRIDFVNLIGSADNIVDFDKMICKFKDVLVFIYATDVNLDKVEHILKSTERHKHFCFIVCNDATLGFSLMQKGALSALILKENISAVETEVFIKNLMIKLREASKLKENAKSKAMIKGVKVNSDKIIVFGSSTGGTEALLSVLKELPSEIPPVVVVQHMPAVFTKMYADRINAICKATVWEASDGDVLRPGLILIAPGDMQSRIIKRGSEYVISCKKEGKVNGVAPSVDVLFNSVYENVSKEVIAVMLTGMGTDGAKGMLKLRNKGALTIGQDEASCVVYGMPRAAYEMGAVKIQAPLHKIAQIILDNI